MRPWLLRRPSAPRLTLSIRSDFAFISSPCRDDSNPIAARCVDDRIEPVVELADRQNAPLAVVSPAVFNLDLVGVEKHIRHKAEIEAATFAGSHSKSTRQYTS